MRFMGTLAVLLLAAAAAPAVASQDIIKDPDGAVVGVVLDCNSCADPAKGKNCSSGAEEGFYAGKPCGKCLLDANFPTRILYAYDLQFMGYLKDESGQPLKNKFVRLYLPNTWTVRTRTGDDGLFRLLLGATAERKGKAQVIKLGDHVMPKDSTATEYALYFMPENYKPCGATKPG
ncbi:MAG: hypothetical protein ABI629_14330, partial [bacterium]